MRLQLSIFTLVMFTLTACAPQTQGPPDSFVGSTYDEDAQSSQAYLLKTLLPPTGIAEIEVSADLVLYHGALAERYQDRRASFIVDYVADDWDFIESMFLEIDGELIYLDTENYTRSVLSRGSIFEQVRFPVKIGLFKQLAEAQEVELSVAGLSREVSPELKARFGAFYTVARKIEQGKYARD